MRTALGLTAATALALSLVSPAQAATTTYQLSLYGAPEERGETSMSWSRAMMLECGPAQGAHPHAEEACELIEAAGGRISDVEGDEDGFCTTIHAPVTAVAVGGGERYEETFANDCLMSLAKGPIFDF
ncbi:SSI family serine proteinase inhibitor [Nocardiopsis sp. MG754419]|uniref:SSI family serine proteinase inhibitor n=1 Tax=Nocardiopsis sp. MG754419 TaxID=2259865 RepID=UPI001BAC695B|nr:SSI family serine proteinase inhibitor [Nocardiopsis sp. MG754419]MBR8742039.1 subtilisin inhibitor-like 2 domain protein [Nocardiopsis sp. MG754419]